MKPNNWLQKKLMQSKHFLVGVWSLLFLSDLFCLLYVAVLWMETGFSILKMSAFGQYLFMIGTIVFIILITMMVFYSKCIQKKEMELRQTYTQQQLEQNQVYQLLLQQKMENIEQERENFNYQIGCMKELAAQNHMQELITYVDQLTNSSDKTILQRLTGHLLLDILYSEKLQKAKGAQIKLSLDYQPDACLEQVDTYDFYLLLGNLLDNAIEAAVNSNGRWVECEMLRKNAYLDLLIVRNSCDASPTFIDGLPVSQRGEGHGYGVKIVQRKAAQYHGDCMFHYDAEKKLFSVHILLPRER